MQLKNGDVCSGIFGRQGWELMIYQPGQAVIYKVCYEINRMGVDCFKTDFGERIPTNVEYADGSDPLKMHNYYAYLYNKTVFDLLVEEKGREEAVVFARSATAGCQKFPVHWGGDCWATYQSMAESLRGGLSLCMSGFGYWSHDIGGFENTATPDIYKRWWLWDASPIAVCMVVNQSGCPGLL